MKQVTILGSTGSIGVSTLDVVARHADRFRVFALTANRDVEGLARQCAAFRPAFAALADPACARELQRRLAGAGLDTRVLGGAEGVSEIAADTGADIVVGGIVGAAGLPSTLAAVRAGRRVLIANKEPLVMLGEQIVREAREHGAPILPLDSEHNAIFQCLPGGFSSPAEGNGSGPLSELGVARILLTGSGGPFRTLPVEQFAAVTPAQACAHPNWVMGRKISVDSATMMNKGLELIEACALFGVGPEKIEIVVHPQSVIHSMVEYVDGSVLAQLGSPDMRVPIAHALGFPERIDSGADRLDLLEVARLDFEAPDPGRFPALRLAAEAARTGGTLPAVLNAANEEAVAAFLAGRLAFSEIPFLIEAVMERAPIVSERSLEAVLDADTTARKLARANIAARTGGPRAT